MIRQELITGRQQSQMAPHRAHLIPTANLHSFCSLCRPTVHKIMNTVTPMSMLLVVLAVWLTSLMRALSASIVYVGLGMKNA